MSLLTTERQNVLEATEIEAAYKKVLTQLDNKGFIDHEALLCFEGNVTRKEKSRKVTLSVNLYDMTDEEFLDWIVVQLGNVDCKSRLRFRLFLLAGLEKMQNFKQIHWVGDN